MFNLYIKITDFLSRQYGYLDNWICRRVLMSLHHGLYYVEESPAGEIETYCGWWVIDKEDVPMMAESRGVPLDITRGTMLWIMDGACTNGTGMWAAQRYLRRRYPQSSGVRGVACLRNNETRLVLAENWKGVADEVVS